MAWGSTRPLRFSALPRRFNGGRQRPPLAVSYHQRHSMILLDGNIIFDSVEDADETTADEQPYGNTGALFDEVMIYDTDLDSVRIMGVTSKNEVSERRVSRYLKMKVYSGCDEGRESEICVVCQVGYEDGEKVGFLDCGHEYHSHCIRRWLLQKNLCPVCRCIALPDRIKRM